MTRLVHKRFVQIAATAAVALAVAGCASIPRVQTEHDPSVDFARYQTYGWREKPSGGTALAMQRIVTRIDEQLRAKGWRQVPVAEADVVLAAHVATHQEHRLDSFYDGPMWTGWGWYGPWAWGPPMGYRTQVTTYTVGTLVVDMFDTSTKRAVWSAVADDTVPNTPAKINADIDAAVARMFLDFPPGKAPPGY
ncbi:DUF4136 domain-containing protein [Luteimonas sp. 8-5]|uniref:DUF4136 domain-containing protein n=1 Tax=Luteimonas sp. 8-5 TaxID=3039387 RepID=UPI002436B6BD|nr:DUF4136 domain-containing protein [Luteimonas sp. 8-5]MDG6347189.1 DUF4136 domain-containing protein [Luteimonas sp. 8-5]